jgi:hypothetical protein
MFLLGTAVMSCGTSLQSSNQIIWQIANYKLGHTYPFE